MSKHSIQDLEKLVNEIKIATGYTLDEIAEAAGYAHGYISQVKTKGKVPDRLMNVLKNKFQNDLKKIYLNRDALSITVEQILNIRAKSDVYGGLIIEILAHLRGMSSSILAEEVNTSLGRRLEMLRDELEDISGR